MILWLLGGLAATKLLQYMVKSSAAKPKSPSEVITQSVLSQPPSAPGQLTPARAAIHGDLMARCNDPHKLRQAAALFGHEGLPACSSALLQKASTIHDMMHGAQDIVERSRKGDQHAMALAKGIGDQARAGNKRAQYSWFLIEQYTKEHPLSAQTVQKAP